MCGINKANTVAGGIGCIFTNKEFISPIRDIVAGITIDVDVFITRQESGTTRRDILSLRSFRIDRTNLGGGLLQM